MADPATIYHWHRLDARITTSGQPSTAELAEIAEIAALGVRRVVNLGLHSHAKALPDEAAVVAALGMAYVHIPVDFANPTGDDFAAFYAAVGGLASAGLARAGAPPARQPPGCSAWLPSPAYTARRAERHCRSLIFASATPQSIEIIGVPGGTKMRTGHCS